LPATLFFGALVAVCPLFVFVSIIFACIIKCCKDSAFFEIVTNEQKNAQLFYDKKAVLS
jgi:hypothetical protein